MELGLGPRQCSPSPGAQLPGHAALDLVQARGDVIGHAQGMAGGREGVGLTPGEVVESPGLRT